MCGRYALSLRPREVRQQLQDAHMPVEVAPDDDDIRQSYNFAPGYHGLVYRADTPDSGAGSKFAKDGGEHAETREEGGVVQQPAVGLDEDLGKRAVHYRLQAMKWGECSSDFRSVTRAPDADGYAPRRSRSLLDKTPSRLR